MLEKIGSSDAIRYMAQDSGLTLQDISVLTGKKKGNLSCRLFQNSRFTIDEFVKVSDVCGWKLVLRRGNNEFELRGIDANKPKNTDK